ncbi:MAG: low temperature requirement protein A [Treponema sp.]|nr:low temperature requirement protein A [Treponema sp.]
MLLKHHILQAWEGPRSASDIIDNRRVTFLELFCDLGYSAYFMKLSFQLSQNISMPGIFIHVCMFALGWWSWLNGTLYQDIHGTNGIRDSFFTFLQMFFVTGMAVFSGYAFTGNSVPFSLSYVGLQGVITYLWWYTGIVDSAYLESKPSSFMLLISLLIFIMSFFFRTPLKYIFWLVSLIVGMSAPLVIYIVYKVRLKTCGKKVPAERAACYRSIAEHSVSYSLTTSLRSRFARMTIIVIGEIMTVIVSGLSEQGLLNLDAYLLIFGSLLTACSMLALYYRAIDEKSVKPGMNFFLLYLVLHLPLTIAVSFVGAGISRTIVLYRMTRHVHDGNLSLLLGLSMSLILLLCVLIQRIFIHEKKHIWRGENYTALIFVPVAFALPFFELQPHIRIILYSLVFFAPIAVDFFQHAVADSDGDSDGIPF